MSGATILQFDPSNDQHYALREYEHMKLVEVADLLESTGLLVTGCEPNAELTLDMIVPLLFVAARALRDVVEEKLVFRPGPRP